MVGDAVSEVSCDGGADKCYCVDGSGHVLGLHVVGVAETCHEGGIEVAEGTGTNDDLLSVSDPLQSGY